MSPTREFGAVEFNPGTDTGGREHLTVDGIRFTDVQFAELAVYEALRALHGLQVAGAAGATATSVASVGTMNPTLQMPTTPIANLAPAGEA